MFFPKFVYMTKNTPFFPNFGRFSAPLNDALAYSAWSWKTTLITWIFWTSLIPPLTFECPPPGHQQTITPLTTFWRPKVAQCIDWTTASATLFAPQGLHTWSNFPGQLKSICWYVSIRGRRVGMGFLTKCDSCIKTKSINSVWYCIKDDDF